MSNWPLSGGGRYETFGADSSTSIGVTPPEAGSNHTKGAYAELIASTSFDYSGVTVWGKMTVLNRTHLFDISIGGSGAEEVIIPNLFFDTYDLGILIRHDFPVVIPAGSRISCREQHNTSTANVNCFGIGFQAGFASDEYVGHSRVYSFGADESDTTGVQIDPGGSANTKGSWTEVVASISADISYIGVGIGQRKNNALADAGFLVDIAIGDSGSEQIILPDLGIGANGASDTRSPFSLGPFPLTIPSGTRIAARAQSSITDAVDRLFDIVLYGVSL